MLLYLVNVYFRRKNQASNSRYSKKECDSGPTSLSLQSKVTSTASAVSQCPFKHRCNTDIINASNQIINNANNKCTKTSTTKSNSTNPFQESSSSALCKSINITKRCRENRNLKKNIKRRRLLHQQYDIAENRSDCEADFSPVLQLGKDESNATERFNTKTLNDTVALQDVSSHSEGSSCEFNHIKQKTWPGNNTLNRDSNTTVNRTEKIKLRRRDSTASLDTTIIDVKECGFEEETMMISGKVVNKDVTIVEPGYSNEYTAYSPDSGFVSESSSAASPSCGNNDEFFNPADLTEGLQKEIQDTKKIVSRCSSSDSGVFVALPEPRKNTALVLCGESVKAAEKLKRDAEKKAGKIYTFLRQKNILILDIS